MKTFKQLIAEVAQPNNDDELNFKEKHTIEVIDNDKPFPTVKKSPRRRADYDEGEDEVVYEASKLDPVGKADADIDNDGDTDNSDEFLHARRKAIAKAMKEASEKKLDPVGKANADIDNDGDTDNSDEYLHARRKAIATAMKKEAVSLKEKAVSQDQQQAAGVALAVKRGDKPKSALIGASKEMYKMSEKDLEDFAKTKHKGLPVKIQEASDSKIIASINAGDSIDVTVQKNLNRKGDNKDEILKVIRDYNWKKRMKKEEVGQIDEDATLDQIRAILTKKNDGTKVVKDKSGYFHIKTANSHKGPFHTMKDVLKDLGESAFVAKAAVAHTDGKKKFKLGDEEFPVTIKPSNAKKIAKQIDETFKVGAVKLNDGSSIIIKEQDAKLLNQLVNELSGPNREAMMKAAMKNKQGFNEILGFAKEAL